METNEINDVHRVNMDSRSTARNLLSMFYSYSLACVEEAYLKVLPLELRVRVCSNIPGSDAMWI
eukprot:scaffold488827_cov59-Attheya_sp.AAC.1